MICQPCNQKCNQGRDCPKARTAAPKWRSRIAREIDDAAVAMICVAIAGAVALAGVGVLLWIA